MNGRHGVGTCVIELANSSYKFTIYYSMDIGISGHSVLISTRIYINYKLQSFLR